MPLLQRIEDLGLFSAIRDSAYAYPLLLWLHILALLVWGGMLLLTDLRLLGFHAAGDALSAIVEGFRRPKRISFTIAALSGILLFGAKAAEYAYDPWFWVKMTLLALLAANYLLLRRGVFPRPTQSGRKMLAAGASLLLLTGAIGAARGPATVKDIMRSMVDPSGDFLFQSVQKISDEQGTREIAPRTDAQWADVGLRAQVLIDARDLLSAPNIRAARPRDRSQNPGVENQPAEVQALIDAHRSDFALRAQNLKEAATIVMQAVDAKDKDALWLSLNTIDRACEGCHVRYWYPNDERAVEAAREAGIIE